MSARSSAEHRQRERRKLPTRRSAPQRRSGDNERRGGHRVAVEQERRSGLDRRRNARPGGRRHRRFDRRVGDRRRQNGAVYSREEIARIRDVIAHPDVRGTCPRCTGPLTFRAPSVGAGCTLREVHCSACGLSVITADYATSRILVVDDDEPIRDALRMLLARSGHEVVTAPHGRVALECCELSSPDLVLTDMIMPVMDGLEFIRRCRNDFPDIRIVAMSANRPHGTRDPLAIARRLAPVQLLRKPFTQQHLLRALDKALGIAPT